MDGQASGGMEEYCVLIVSQNLNATEPGPEVVTASSAKDHRHPQATGKTSPPVDQHRQFVGEQTASRGTSPAYFSEPGYESHQPPASTDAMLGIPEVTQFREAQSADDAEQRLHCAHDIPTSSRTRRLSGSSVYGTFPKSKKKKGKVSFDVKEHQKNKHRVHRVQPAVTEVPKRISTRHWTGNKESLLSKSEVAHLCEDAYDEVAERPTWAHWRALLFVTGVCCPCLGLIGVVFLCKASHSARHNESERAVRMIRHSNFCFRLAVICGIILWFMIMLLVLLYTH